jgi:hypothetical protein
MKIQSELPEDLSKFSFLAAACCAENGQDISVCSEALRGFVAVHPEAAETVSDEAAPIKKIAAGAVREDADAEPEAKPELGHEQDPEVDDVQVILSETDEAKQERAAFDLLVKTDPNSRRDALRRFYLSGSDRLRRVAIAYIFEQTRDGKLSMVVEVSSAEDAMSSGDPSRIEKVERDLVTATLTRVELDRATGAFTCRFANSNCTGTLGDDYVVLATTGRIFVSVKLAPAREKAVLDGHLVTKDGDKIGISVRLM